MGPGPVTTTTTTTGHHHWQQRGAPSTTPPCTATCTATGTATVSATPRIARPDAADRLRPPFAWLPDDDSVRPPAPASTSPSSWPRTRLSIDGDAVITAAGPSSNTSGAISPPLPQSSFTFAPAPVPPPPPPPPHLLPSRPVPPPLAMSGHPPPKRTLDDAAQGEGSGQPGTSRIKLPRLDRPPEQFSSVVKDRMQSNTRTGQACDRCKVRKIRCDGALEGCSNCGNLGVKCLVTDRITGRTEERGFLQRLERDTDSMKVRMHELEKLLSEKGVEVDPWQSPDVPPSARRLPSGPDWVQSGPVWVRDQSSSAGHDSALSFPRNKLESRPEKSHLGVGQDYAPLSSLRGTRLSILGATIDMASFDSPDVDEPPPDAGPSTPLYNKSLQSFIQSAMRINPPMIANLPSREDAFTYSEWYFLTISSFLPLLHKPTFMRTLARIYDEPGFEPSVPELVTVHMVFAIIYFQYGVRNWQNADQRLLLNNLSNKHYHFALSKIYDLAVCRNLASVQALALISLHTRAFPKPGCGAMVANMALQSALDINLHRPWKKPGEGTNLENELRKRAWWVILAVSMAITGRQGRPMPLTVEEFDTPFPEPIADELLSEEGVDTSQSVPCPYENGIAGFKIVPISMEVYSHIYSVRRDTRNYANIVHALERQLQQWEDEIPNYLKLENCEHQDQLRVAALYLKTFVLEARLCLRHPSVATTTDEKMLAENSRICEETGREMLYCTHEILKLKALDTTWYQLSVYTMSAFSMLVGHWGRRFETTPEQIASLRQDMDKWMEVLTETSSLLGPGPEISSKIGQIFEWTIACIEQDRRADGRGATLPGAGRLQPRPGHHMQPPPQSQSHGQAPRQAAPDPPIKEERPEQASGFQPASQSTAAAPSGTAQANDPHKGYFQEADMSGQTSYPSLGYGDGNQNAMPHSSYEAGGSMYFGASAQAAAAAAVAASGVPDSSSSQSNPLVTFASQATQHVDGTPTPTDLMWSNRGTAWHDWTTGMVQNQDRYGANALLTLGNAPREPAPGSMMPGGTVGQSTGEMGTVPHADQWPLILFEHAPASGS